MDEHETIIDALQKREDANGTVGWLHLNQTHVSVFFIVLFISICTMHNLITCMFVLSILI